MTGLVARAVGGRPTNRRIHVELTENEIRRTRQILRDYEEEHEKACDCCLFKVVINTLTEALER